MCRCGGVGCVLGSCGVVMGPKRPKGASVRIMYKHRLSVADDHSSSDKAMWKGFLKVDNLKNVAFVRFGEG